MRKRCRNSRTLLLSQTLFPPGTRSLQPPPNPLIRLLKAQGRPCPGVQVPELLNQLWDSSVPTNPSELCASPRTPGPKYTGHLWPRNRGAEVKRAPESGGDKEEGGRPARAWRGMGPAPRWLASAGLGAEAGSRAVMCSRLPGEARLMANRIRCPSQAAPFLCLPHPAHQPPPLPTHTHPAFQPHPP